MWSFDEYSNNELSCFIASIDDEAYVFSSVRYKDQYRRTNMQGITFRPNTQFYKIDSVWINNTTLPVVYILYFILFDIIYPRYVCTSSESGHKVFLKQNTVCTYVCMFEHVKTCIPI